MEVPESQGLVLKYVEIAESTISEQLLELCLDFHERLSQCSKVSKYDSSYIIAEDMET